MNASAARPRHWLDSLGRRARATVPILMYHQVTPRPDPAFRKYAITPEAFGAQMKWLKGEGYAAVGLEALYESRANGGALPAKPVVITFDDGFEDCMDFAVPALAACGFTAMFYVVAGLIDKTSAWLDGNVGALPLMSWRSIRDLESAGLSCGAHGMSHLNLSQVSAEVCRQELQQSRALLEDRLGHEVRHLAYPYGGYNEEVRAIAVESGYRTACSVRWGWSPFDDDLMALHRIHVQESLANLVRHLRHPRSPMEIARAGARALRRMTGVA